MDGLALVRPKVWWTEIGTPRHFQWLRALVWVIAGLNIADGLLTLLWLRLEIASEANVLLQDLVERPGLFLSAKIILVSAGLALLWRHRQRPLAVIGVFLAADVYYLVFLQHVQAAVLFVLAPLELRETHLLLQLWT